ncbi:MAG: hypothetical protein O3A60_05085 [Planctomycetota bacterium]|nr:hypothetical protein [Planctomycetota bacterium]
MIFNSHRRCRNGGGLRLFAEGIITSVLAATSVAVSAIDVDLAIERELLARLLSEGHYRQAIVESERLEKAVKPRKKDAEYLGRAAATAEMLVYRGIMQTRMGDLDAAEESLQAAFRQLNDRDFQAHLALSQRRSGNDAKAVAAYASVLSLELTDAACQLLVDRLRRANEFYRAFAGAASDDPAEAARMKAITGWIKRLDLLTGDTLNARAAIEKQLSGVPAEIASSSRFKALKSESRPRMYAAFRSLEVSKLPWTVSEEDGTQGDDQSPAEGSMTETAVQRQSAADRQRQRAFVLLNQAAEDLDTAIGAAPLPEKPRSADKPSPAPAAQVFPHKTTGTLSAAAASKTGGDETAAKASAAATAEQQQQDAAILHAELLEGFAEAHFLDGNLAAARDSIDGVLVLRRQARGEQHPELARASILSAEIAMLEAEEARRGREPRLARKKSEDAVAAIELAQQLLTSPTSEFDPKSPLHELLSHLLDEGKQSRKTSADAVAATDAADAAASRAMSAIRRQESAAEKPSQSN